MATPRETIAAQIATDHPLWLVWPYPDVPKNVAKDRPVVSVWRGTVAPGESRQTLRHDLTLNVYGAKRIADGVEDELDDLLDGVMLSLERVDGFRFTQAERQSFANDTIAGWQITGSVASANVYRSIIIEERSTP